MNIVIKLFQVHMNLILKVKNPSCLGGFVTTTIWGQ